MSSVDEPRDVISRMLALTAQLREVIPSSAAGALDQVETGLRELAEWKPWRVDTDEDFYFALAPDAPAAALTLAKALEFRQAENLTVTDMADETEIEAYKAVYRGRPGEYHLLDQDGEAVDTEGTWPPWAGPPQWGTS